VTSSGYHTYLVVKRSQQDAVGGVEVHNLWGNATLKGVVPCQEQLVDLQQAGRSAICQPSKLCYSPLLVALCAGMLRIDQHNSGNTDGHSSLAQWRASSNCYCATACIIGSIRNMTRARPSAAEQGCTVLSIWH
jgi:hypothetical protein